VLECEHADLVGERSRFGITTTLLFCFLWHVMRLTRGALALRATPCAAFCTAVWPRFATLYKRIFLMSPPPSLLFKSSVAAVRFFQDRVLEEEKVTCQRSAF
jgi:hypothetical protein